MRSMDQKPGPETKLGAPETGKSGNAPSGSSSKDIAYDEGPAPAAVVHRGRALGRAQIHATASSLHAGAAALACGGIVVLPICLSPACVTVDNSRMESCMVKLTCWTPLFLSAACGRGSVGLRGRRDAAWLCVSAWTYVAPVAPTALFF